MEIETPSPSRRGKSRPHRRTQHDRNLRHRCAPRVRRTRHDGYRGSGRNRPHARRRAQPVGRSHPHRRCGAGSDHDSRGRRATADRSRRGPHRGADRRRVRGRSQPACGCVVRTGARCIGSNRLDPIGTRPGCRACAHAGPLRVTATDVSPGHLAPCDHTAHHDPTTTTTNTAADDPRELSIS